MRAFLTATVQFLRGDAGPTATEYALLLAMIAVLCAPAAALLGYRTMKVTEAVSAAQARALEEPDDDEAVEQYHFEKRTHGLLMAGAVAALILLITAGGFAVYLLTSKAANEIEHQVAVKKVRDSTDSERVEATMVKIESGVFVVPEGLASHRPQPRGHGSKLFAKGSKPLLVDRPLPPPPPDATPKPGQIPVAEIMRRLRRPPDRQPPTTPMS